MSVDELTDRYAALQAKGTELAGGLLDIPRRVGLLTQMAEECRGNHVFPLIAAHGALWALGYFEAGGSLGRLIAKRYFYSSEERIYRLDLLREFAERFRVVNRQVCIDSYANYTFTRDHGEESGAADVLPASLLDALNRVHAANRQGTALSHGEKRAVFEQTFRCEQEVTVSRGVQEAIAGFDCRIMRLLCLKPIVRFAYFPSFKYLFFWNFGDMQERIDKGLAAYDLAVRAGWERMQRTLMDYGHMPMRFAENRSQYVAEIFGGS